MAAKIQVGSELSNEKVDCLPPPGPRYNHEYQKAFHYRGKLFCSSANKLRTLCQQFPNEFVPNEFENRTLYGKTTEREIPRTCDRPQSGIVSRPPSYSKPIRPRRIQSAKGRLEKSLTKDESSSNLEKSGSQVSVVDIKFHVDFPEKNVKRPLSPFALHLPRKPDTSIEKSASRPTSAKAAVGRQIPKEDCEDDGVRPSVYGLKLKRQVFGSDPGIFDGAIPDKESPYILSDETIRKEQNSQDDNIRPMPSCLEPLRPWLTTDISSDIIGVDPTSCLVFLSVSMDDLPEVPPPQGPEEDLVCMGQLPPKKPPPPKKYSHPFFERQLKSGWECNHRPMKKICRDDGTVIYMRYEGQRTKDVVRKEITELENLMQGIGSYDSDCMIVQYQADITRIREMIEETMGKIPDRIRSPPEPPDTFGLRKFCVEHDALMKKIRAQRDLCIQELAMLESGMDLEDTQRYFSSQSLQVSVPAPAT